MSEQQQAFRKALGNYPTGVTVVTTFNEDHNPLGLTVNSFASVSLDPLLILWSIDKKSKSYNEFIKTKKFAVNILASDQQDLCNLFASKNEDRFSQCDWRESIQGLPVLEDTLSILECETAEQVNAGDHTVLIGRVINIENAEKEPLLYHRRNIGAIPEAFYK
ncbi:flavin reductase family protein [Viridibacillus sp. YIM B01967]|uniref:Flavin reductase family protein n=1 Tax=Viridibacillus soli TaxID=2798301 RepID=A0ABS1H843_9BACL|nr:flavin reductase family protein [Viridibacillus soli]MBK3495566.1 flavin reductase family protein [Viridibacillus soli]